MSDLIKLINEQISELDNLNKIKDIVSPETIKRIVDKQLELLNKLKLRFQEGHFRR